MPNDDKTPMRSFRIPEELYRAALAKARAGDRSLSDVVRVALEVYVADDGLL